MTENRAPAENQLPETEEEPENLQPKTWLTLVLFAGFVVLGGTCIANFVF